MKIEMFREIVKKAKSEGFDSIYLYNWTEPLIHPHIDQFIEAINEAGLRSGISSNLNIAKNMEKALLAEPSFFRISLSGFHQETYVKGHAGGDIATVKRNMSTLSSLRQTRKINTEIEVYYHRYVDNLEEEALMREYSHRLGFKFSTGYSIMMPLEKTLAIVEHDPSVTQADHETLERLALPPYDDLINLVKHYPKQACNLIDEVTVVDCNGNTILCCAVFNQSEHQVGKYLDRPIDELTQLKYTQKSCADMCNRCMKNGLHFYAMTPNEGSMQLHAVKRIVDFQHRSILNLPIDSKKLGRDGEISKADFDEQRYLALHYDVRLAISHGVFTSGYQHYVLFGRFENRPGASLSTAV